MCMMKENESWSDGKQVPEQTNNFVWVKRENSDLYLQKICLKNNDASTETGIADLFKIKFTYDLHEIGDTPCKM